MERHESVAAPVHGAMLAIGARAVPIQYVRHPRARRYLLRVKPDGVARVTVPRHGSLAEAERFVHRHQAWIEAQLIKIASRPVVDHRWKVGHSFLLRGARVELRASPDGLSMVFLDQAIAIHPEQADARTAVEARLRRLAGIELEARTRDLSRQLNLPIRRVSIRSQRSRWGSCSVRGTISLNWRLIQMPDWVRDYVIVHELMHLREMNHSRRFWRCVWEVCPHYREAIRWIKENAEELKHGTAPQVD